MALSDPRSGLAPAPVISGKPRKVIRASNVAAGLVRSIRPRRIAAIPWSKKTHQMLDCSVGTAVVDIVRASLLRGQGVLSVRDTIERTHLGIIIR
jgi:hypothetical protein